MGEAAWRGGGTTVGGVVLPSLHPCYTRVTAATISGRRWRLGLTTTVGQSPPDLQPLLTQRPSALARRSRRPRQPALSSCCVSPASAVDVHAGSAAAAAAAAVVVAASPPTHRILPPLPTPSRSRQPLSSDRISDPVIGNGTTLRGEITTDHNASTSSTTAAASSAPAGAASCSSAPAAGSSVGAASSAALAMASSGSSAILR
jgi:hypothetical protein